MSLYIRAICTWKITLNYSLLTFHISAICGKALGLSSPSPSSSSLSFLSSTSAAIVICDGVFRGKAITLANDTQNYEYKIMNAELVYIFVCLQIVRYEAYIAKGDDDGRSEWILTKNMCKVVLWFHICNKHDYDVVLKEIQTNCADSIFRTFSSFFRIFIFMCFICACVCVCLCVSIEELYATAFVSSFIPHRNNHIMPI